MKTLIKRRGITMLVVLVITLFATCSDPTDEDVVPKEEEEVTPGEADALLEILAFSSGTKITGSVPSVVNSSLVKTDSEDTVYTLPGVKMLLRLSHPISMPVKGWYIAAKGSTYYYDVPIDDEEDSDSVSVVIFEIDAEDDEAPYDIPVEITPYDNNNQPIDKIERTITVEKPSLNDCDILIPGDTAIYSGNPFKWNWSWTVVLDPNDKGTFVNAPGRKFKSTQKPTGCCNNQAVCPAFVFNQTLQKWEWVYNSQVTAETSYSIWDEAFGFYNDGTFARYTREYIVNFDPLSTDWCSSAPAYSINDSEVRYYGTHDFVPGNSTLFYSTSRKVCNDPLGLCGYGSRPGSIKYSCHTLVITIDRLMLDFTKEVRMYHSAQSQNYFAWKD